MAEVLFVSGRDLDPVNAVYTMPPLNFPLRCISGSQFYAVYFFFYTLFGESYILYVKDRLILPSLVEMTFYLMSWSKAVSDSVLAPR